MTDSLPMPVTTLTAAQRMALINLVRRAAKAEILPRFRALSSHQIDTKSGPQDLVTDADRDAEAMITRGLLRLFPNALIIGEEHVASHPEVVDKMADAELSFTIDPVDGTWNYAKGLATFGVIVSACRFGKPIFGMLYDPLMNDLIIADESSPAQMIMPRRAARTVRTSAGGALDTLNGCLPLYLLPRDKQDAMAASFTRFQRIANLRCACHEFRMLAQGHFDFVLSAKLTPWDQSAGALITAQAGGHVAMLDGSEYRADTRSGYLLSACNAETWARVRDVYAFLLDDSPAA